VPEPRRPLLTASVRQAPPPRSESTAHRHHCQNKYGQQGKCADQRPKSGHPVAIRFAGVIDHRLWVVGLEEHFELNAVGVLERQDRTVFALGDRSVNDAELLELC
jgi:hypothetical protein